MSLAPTRMLSRLLPLCALACCFCAHAGPSHYGFGQGYLAAIESTPSGNRLAVYEPPLRAKNTNWFPRWLDRSHTFDNVLPGGLAVGDFWPSDFGKAWLVTVSQSGPNASLKVLEPPETVSTKPWPVV